MTSGGRPLELAPPLQGINPDCAPLSVWLIRVSPRTRNVERPDRGYLIREVPLFLGQGGQRLCRGFTRASTPPSNLPKQTGASLIRISRIAWRGGHPLPRVRSSRRSGRRSGRLARPPHLQQPSSSIRPESSSSAPAYQSPRPSRAVAVQDGRQAAVGLSLTAASAMAHWNPPGRLADLHSDCNHIRVRCFIPLGSPLRVKEQTAELGSARARTGKPCRCRQGSVRG